MRTNQCLKLFSTAKAVGAPGIAAKPIHASQAKPTMLVSLPTFFNQPKRHFAQEIGSNIGNGLAMLALLEVGTIGVAGLLGYYKGRRDNQSLAANYYKKINCPQIKEVILALNEQQRTAVASLLSYHQVDIAKVKCSTKSEAAEWLLKHKDLALTELQQQSEKITVDAPPSTPVSGR